MTRHPLYYQILGYALYFVGGLALAINTRCTALAYANEGAPLQLGWMLACLYSAIAIGVSLFLTNPVTWGQLWASFVTTAASTRQGGGAPKVITATILALLVVGMIAFVSAVYVADWRSTSDYIGQFVSAGFYSMTAVGALIIGPEVSFIVAHSVLSMGKRSAIQTLTESSQLDPQRVYLAAVRRNGLKMAKQAAAASAGQRQHPR